MNKSIATVVGVAALITTLGMAEGGYGPKATAVASLVVWWTMIVGVAASLWPAPQVRRSAIVAASALAGLAILSATSMIWAQADNAAFQEANKLAAYLGVFVLVIATAESIKARDILHGVALGLVAITVVSLVGRFEPDLIGGGADQALSVSTSAAQGRLSYPIGYWNGLAACLAIAAVLLVWIGGTAPARAIRAVAPASLALIGLGLYLAGSRGGLVATATGLVVLLALSRERSRMFLAAIPGLIGAGVLVLLASRRPELVDALSSAEVGSQGHEMMVASGGVALAVGITALLCDSRFARIHIPRRPVIGVLAALGLAAVVAFIVSGPQQHLDNFVESSDGSALEDSGAAGNFDSSSGSGRYEFWRVGLDAFAGDPALGVGAGNYEFEWNTESEAGGVVLDAHSLYIETLAELGLAGAALLLAFAAAIVWAARRPRGARSRGDLAAAAAIVAAGAVSAVFDWTYEIPAAFAPLIVAAALVTRTATGSPLDARDTPIQRRSTFGLGIMTLLAAWCAIWIAGMVLIGEVQIEESQASVERAELEEAAEHAVYATEVQPWSEDAYIQLAQVEALSGNQEAALNAAQEAVDRNRENWRSWFVLAQVSLEAGDLGGAREALLEARDLSPQAIPVDALALDN